MFLTDGVRFIKLEINRYIVGIQEDPDGTRVSATAIDTGYNFVFPCGSMVMKVATSEEVLKALLDIATYEQTDEVLADQRNKLTAALKSVMNSIQKGGAYAL